MRAVCPEALSSNKILKPISIDICQRKRVNLRKRNAILVRFGVAIEKQMLFKRDFAVVLHLAIYAAVCPMARYSVQLYPVLCYLAGTVFVSRDAEFF